MNRIKIKEKNQKLTRKKKKKKIMLRGKVKEIYH